MKEPTAEFIAALASCMGGILTPQEGGRLPVIVFDSPRCQLHIRASWEARPKWRAYIMDLDGRNIHRSQSANFSPSRPVPDIAADIRRRVLDASRQAIITHGISRRQQQAKADDISTRLARLEAAMGATNNTEGYHHNHFVRLPGLRISTEYNFGQGTRYCAEITVHSLDCLVMIARIIAEDQRLHAAA
jgi:hypothetical protein